MNDSYDGAGLALFGVLFFILTIFAVAAYVLGSWFLMKIFDKAGVQGRWRAWIPVYNTMVFAKLGDLNPWLILIAIGAGIFLNWIPVIGPVISIAAWLVSILAAWRVGLKLQKEAAWVILYFFLPIVWLGILGFDRSRWNTAVPPAPWAGNSFLRDSTTWSGIPIQAGSYPSGPPAAQGYGAPGGYPSAAVGTPPGGYAGPPAGYTPPPAYQPPPADYSAPPAGYTAPPAGYGPPPAGYTPPPSAPAGYAAAPSAASAPEPPAAPQAPGAPEPPAAPPAPIMPEPPAPAEPPAFPAPPAEPPPPVTPEPGPPVVPEPAPPITPEPPVSPEPENPRTV